MNLQISAKKMTVNQAFTDYAEKKLSQKLDRFFGEGTDSKIMMTTMRDIVTMELTVKYDNLIFRAEQSAADKNDALDACIDRIIRQIRKNKTKVEKRLRDTAFKEAYPDFVEEQTSFDIVKHKKFVMHPMTLDEAILQMNMLDHNFFMFINGATGDTNVVYKRSDGNYAVLEPSRE